MLLLCVIIMNNELEGFIFVVWDSKFSALKKETPGKKWDIKISPMGHAAKVRRRWSIVLTCHMLRVNIYRPIKRNIQAEVAGRIPSSILLICYITSAIVNFELRESAFPSNWLHHILRNRSTAGKDEQIFGIPLWGLWWVVQKFRNTILCHRL